MESIFNKGNKCYIMLIKDNISNWMGKMNSLWEGCRDVDGV